MTNDRIDVLGILDDAASKLGFGDGYQVQKARAVVAEIIEADKAYDAARSAYNDAVNCLGVVKQRDTRKDMDSAKKRRGAAIARVGAP